MPDHNGVMIDAESLQHAYEKVRQELLDERIECLDSSGHWIGELASSALSTATAVSALAVVRKHLDGPLSIHAQREARELSPEDLAAIFNRLIAAGIEWLAERQNPDGGFGDTDLSHSNIATTMLVVAAIHLAGETAAHAELLRRANRYIDDQGRLEGLRRRYGKDKTFVVPIMTNCALAGLIDWRQISPLPFELAWVPQAWYRFMRMPVVSYAIPALVAIGQARYFHVKPWNPLTRVVRAAAVRPTMRVLERMQPQSGGYLEATPLTSFVVMSLAATGRAAHRVTQRGVQFLVDSARADGSWPIDTNLATWNTSLALNALATAGEDISLLSSTDDEAPPGCLNWLLRCQHRERHPFTGADPGGWGWSDLSGAVPDADDTPGALLALAHWHQAPSCHDWDKPRIVEAAAHGIQWLLGLQNRDGGWPTFCRGWGKLPFDRSGADLTAHALRALHAWGDAVSTKPFQSLGITPQRLQAATERGLRYLQRLQQNDGSFLPLWFGNQDHPAEENPVYGTSKVLLAYCELGLANRKEARRAHDWLVAAQNSDGGWGGSFPSGGSALRGVPPNGAEAHSLPFAQPTSSVEETAIAVDALFAAAQKDTQLPDSLQRGVRWLVEKIQRNRHRDCSPIGFYFAKLWYYERLYPLTFTVGAMGRAARWIAAAGSSNLASPCRPVERTP